MKIRITKLPKNRYSIGGVLQSHGSDWSDGLVTIGAGGSHEENEYEGVQLGTDNGGIPNLVEENETVWNNYVFSARIPIDQTTKKIFHIGKKQEITYADLAKRLEKEIAERPNDPISKSGFNAQMQQLAEQQERQKQEMEAERAEEAFEALSPEEKVATMAILQQREQNEGAEMVSQPTEEEMMAQQQMAQQMSPEEMAMMQQRQGAPTADAMGTVAQPQMAYGGKVNRYDFGGALKWLNKNRKDIPAKQRKVLATIMGKVRMNGLFDSDDAFYKQQFENLIPTLNFSESNVSRYFEALVKSGIDKNTAFDLVWPSSRRIKGADTEGLRKRLFKQVSSQGSTQRAAAKQSTKTKAAQATPSAPVNTGWSPTPIFNTSAPQWFTGSAPVATTNNNRQTAATQEPSVAPALFTPPTEDYPQWFTGEAEQTAVANAGAATSAPSAQSAKAQRTAARRATSRSTAEPEVNSLNTGEWNNTVDNPWNTFTRPGLDQYIARQEAALLDPTLTAEQKAAIRQRVADEINGVQESYFNNVVPTLGQSRTPYSEGVAKHQQLFQDRQGNIGFTGIDEGGNITYSIEDAIDKPQGANTSDVVGGNYVDGYNGPKTGIRYWGATGDDVSDIAQRLANIGIDYSPYDNWNFGDNRKLYRASIIGGNQSTAAQLVAGSGTSSSNSTATEEPFNYLQRPEDIPSNTDENGLVKTPWGEYAKNKATTTATAPETTDAKGDSVEPKHRAGWLRYAGLFGPAVGLGMQALGIGKPDTSAIDTAIAGAGNVNLARWKPLGNYLTYRPLDIWYQQNALNAQSRATDRALLNASGANSGAAMAGLLSNGYNSQIASGNLFRQAQEYNDALRNQVAQFNRGTDQFNSEQFGVTSRFNADARNNANRAYAQLRLGAASQKADMNAGWNQGIYGNVSGLFKGIGDIGRENEQYNWLSDLAADGYFGNLGNSNTGKRWVKKKTPSAAYGGKLRKKGLTI